MGILNILTLIKIYETGAQMNCCILTPGWSRISGKGVGMYKGVGGSPCWFYIIFLKYPMKM